MEDQGFLIVDQVEQVMTCVTLLCVLACRSIGVVA